MKKYIIGLMAVTSLASCSNDEIRMETTSGRDVVKASFEGGTQSRVGFTDATPAMFFWNEGDKISVHSTSSTNPFVDYTLTSGAGTGTAEFTGNLVGEGTVTSVCALYPANKNHKYDESGRLTFHMAETYDYSSYTDGEFGLQNGGKSISTNAPMLAQIAKDGDVNFSFKHLGGVFCFQIAKIPAKATKFVFTANTKITGDFVVDLTADQPSIGTTADESSASETSEGKAVTISFTAGTEKRVFYVPVPTGTYNGFSWSMQDNAGNVLASFTSEAENTVERATLLRMPLLTCSTVSGGITSAVETVVDLNKLLSTNSSTGLPTSVTVINATNISSAIEIPVASTTESPQELNLTFNEVPTAQSGSDSKYIEIKQKGDDIATPTESKMNVEVAIPEVPADAAAPSLKITMPSATVTLAATGETTTYDKVESTTATNTLVLDKGVTVNNLTVKGGNVRVNDGATLSEVTNSLPGNEKVTIYVETKEMENTLLGKIEKDKFNIVNVKSEEENLINAAKNGGDYTMKGDITLSSPLVVEKTMKLNLNGFKLMANATSFSDATGLTGSHQCVVLVRRGGNLTVEGEGSIDYNKNEEIFSAIILTNSADEDDANLKNQAAVLTVDGGHLKGHYYGICGNGNRHGTEITINGGIVEGGATGVYHPQNGTMIVEGGKIIGGTQTGIEMRSGKLTVNNGIIRSNAETFEGSGNGNGTTVKGAAVAVSQHTTQIELSATIKGGTLEGLYALYENDYHGEPVDKISLSITGGTLNGQVHSENCSGFVTGGTFSDPNALAYLGDDAKDVKVQLAADTELAKSIVVEKGTVTIDLGTHTLTAAKTAIVDNKVRVIAVKGGAAVTVQNGTIGNGSYGVYAFDNANVTLDNIVFGESVLYAYNGNVKGKLSATDCTFKGWLSGWYDGSTFTRCIFTIGKAYYPAAICYGNTTFTDCKFFNNGTDADEYDDKNTADSDGYYRCNYVVAGCNPTTTIDFVTCKFIDANNTESNIAVDNHPYHTCGDWGDGQIADAQIKVDGQSITSKCHGTQASSGTNSGE